MVRVKQNKHQNHTASQKTESKTLSHIIFIHQISLENADSQY
jgi:hypothetical protein